MEKTEIRVGIKYFHSKCLTPTEVKNELNALKMHHAK